MFRGVLDRLLGAVARFTLLGFFRTVEVEGGGHIPGGGLPILVVANHFNGFVDPVAIVRALGRVPRFLAKSTLWKIWPGRPFLALAGLIPVHRAQDVADRSANVAAFRAAHEVLARRQTVAIFPEGISHDETRLAELRTGAARIALGARDSGVRGLQILPIGLLFESKVALRSRLLIRIGSPIDLDDVVTDLGGGDGGTAAIDQEAVRRLTALIRDRLGAVSPDYPSARERSDLALAADIVLRDTGPRPVEVRLSDRERLAQRLARRPDHVRARIRAVLGEYLLELHALGLEDTELVGTFSKRLLLARLLVTGGVVALVATFALIGLAVNVVPYLMVAAAGRRARNPASKGTARFLTALVVFPVAWFVVAAQVVDGWPRVLLLGFGYALAGLLVVRALESVGQLVADYRSWQSVRERAALLPQARARRAEVVAQIREAAA